MTGVAPANNDSKENVAGLSCAPKSKEMTIEPKQPPARPIPATTMANQDYA